MVLVGVSVFIVWLVDLILLWDPVSTMLTVCTVGIVLFLLPPALGCHSTSHRDGRSAGHGHQVADSSSAAEWNSILRSAAIERTKSVITMWRAFL
eukprot:1392506-Amphidinium_carterae.1